MKFLSITVLMLSCLVASSVAQTFYEEIFKAFIERIRPRLQCGFKQINLPSVDPLNLAAYNLFLRDIEIAQNVNVTVMNVEARGLSKFQVQNVSAALLTGKLAFNVTYPELTFKGQHLITGSAYGSPFVGSGPFDIVARNVQAESAIEFTWWPQLQIKSHNANVTIESVTSNFTGFGSSNTDNQINSLLSAGAPDWIAKNQDYVNGEVRKVVLGYVNALLKQTSSLNEFVISMITYNPSTGC